MTVNVAAAISEINRNPKSFAGLLSIGLLGFAFLTVFFGWLAGANLIVPLILLGVMAITVLVLLTSNTLVLIMALLIIGTIVTNEEFLLKIGILIRGDKTGLQEILADYRSGTSGAKVELGEVVALAVRKELGARARPDTVQRIEGIVSSAQYERIAQRVARQGALNALQALATGESRWETFVDAFETLEAFTGDIAFLRREDLADCESGDTRSCRISDLGARVLDISLATLLTNPLFELQPSREEVPANLRALPLLVLDGAILNGSLENGAGSVWFRFEVSEPTTATIEALSRSAFDPVIWVYDINRLEAGAIASDDDGGEQLDSKLNIRLGPGEYVLQVKNWDETPGDFSVRVVSGKSAASE